MQIAINKTNMIKLIAHIVTSSPKQSKSGLISLYRRKTLMSCVGKK